MLRRRIKRPRARIHIGVKLLIFIIIITTIAAVWAVREQPMIRDVAQSELESIAFDIVNRALEDELERTNLTYDELVIIKRDESGKVTSIQTNVQQMNMLKIRVSNALSDEMFERVGETVMIPLGNLIGIDILTGRGPKLWFKPMWVSGVDAKYENSFTQAGINQTRHQIMMDFSINVGMMFYGRTIGVDTGTKICVAETIIVGETPQFYAAMATEN